MDTYPHAMDPGTPADKIVQVDPAVPTAPVRVPAKASAKKASTPAPAPATPSEG